MPRRSRATSRIGRFLAASAISMSLFGLRCWGASSGAADFLAGWAEDIRTTFFRVECEIKSRQAGSDGELGGRGEFGGADLGAICRLDAEHADAAVRAGDREAFGIDCDHLAHLAGDSGGLFRRQRFRIEDLQLLAVV